MKLPIPPLPDVAKSNYNTHQNGNRITSLLIFQKNLRHFWGLTSKTARVPKKKRMYPNKFRFLVFIVASWYASIASVARENGW